MSLSIDFRYHFKVYWVHTIAVFRFVLINTEKEVNSGHSFVIETITLTILERDRFARTTSLVVFCTWVNAQITEEVFVQVIKD